MKRKRNPYRSPRSINVSSEVQRLSMTRRFSARFVVVGLVAAQIQLLRGGYKLLAASMSLGRSFDDDLLEGKFQELLAASRQQQRVSGALIVLAAGLLAGFSIAVWRYRLRVLSPERQDSDLLDLMRRCALYSFAVACVSMVLRTTNYFSVLAELPPVLDFMSLGAALAAIALGADLKVPWRAAVSTYMLASLGMLLSGYGLAQLARRMIQVGQWQLQSWGWL
jgi:hypothetical protein